jgi:hypothetical protein
MFILSALARFRKPHTQGDAINFIMMKYPLGQWPRLLAMPCERRRVCIVYPSFTHRLCTAYGLQE